MADYVVWSDSFCDMYKPLQHSFVFLIRVWISTETKLSGTNVAVLWEVFWEIKQKPLVFENFHNWPSSILQVKGQKKRFYLARL